MSIADYRPSVYAEVREQLGEAMKNHRDRARRYREEGQTVAAEHCELAVEAYQLARDALVDTAVKAPEKRPPHHQVKWAGEYIQALQEAGVIAEKIPVRRVVVDAKVGELLQVYVDQVGDTRLLDVFQGIDGTQVAVSVLGEKVGGGG